jgi:hypothetical protein
MISDDKIFDYLTTRANQTSNDTEAGLKLFIPMYSAILGGSIWLSDKLEDPIPVRYRYLSNALVALLTIVCIYVVLDNLRAWWGYRVQLAEITKESKYPLPPPQWHAAVIEVVLCLGMLGACAMYVWFNPFV